MEPINLYRWVNDNNPSPELSYGKGWWDYVQFLYDLDELYGRDKMMVVSTYSMRTPPPQEILLMPVARLETDRAAFIVKKEFSYGFHPDWTVSVIRADAERGPLYGLIDEHEAIEPANVDGFLPEWIFPSYATSPGRFTARVKDDRELHAFIWILAHSAFESRRWDDAEEREQHEREKVLDELVAQAQVDGDYDR
jgi:hypothetical protein